MGLDYKRERHVGSHHSSVDLLERDSERNRVYDDDAPLPELRGATAPRLSHDVKDAGAAGAAGTVADAGDAELAEFVAFFTGAHQRVAAPTPVQQPTAQPATGATGATGATRGRVRRATERVIHVAAIRPVVRVPDVPRTLRARVIDTRLTRPADADVEDAEPAPATRAYKLPPIWLLTNLAIVAALLFGFAPQIMTASAAAGCNWYRVRPGDTLSKIGHRYGVSVNQLASSNHIQNINLIYVDQNMCIPLMPLASSNQPAPAPAAHPPTYSAPANVKSFINYTLPYARQASRQTGWPVSVILAQWGLETGWRTQTYTGFNWGNCGAMPDQPTIGGINKPGSPAAFAYANSPAQGLAEYTHVAHLGYYTRIAQAARSGGADAAARALGQSPWDWGHYTNHGDPGSSLISIMRVYNLYYYDTH